MCVHNIFFIRYLQRNVSDLRNDRGGENHHPFFRHPVFRVCFPYALNIFGVHKPLLTPYAHLFSRKNNNYNQIKQRHFFILQSFSNIYYESC